MVKSVKAQWHEVDNFRENLNMKTRLTNMVSRGKRKTVGTMAIQKWYNVVNDSVAKTFC